MKTNIVYTDKLPSTKQVDELKQLLPFLDIRFIKYDGAFKSVGNIQLDFNWLKTLSGDADIKCFLTTIQKLEQAGIKSHIGLYNLENDKTHDFYISIPVRLDARARANGFKSNFAWIFCHEFLHGVYWNKYRTFAMADGEVHAAEKLGKLKEILATYVAEYGKVKVLEKQLSLLQQLLAKLLPPTPTTLLHPVPEKFRRVTQSYGVPNPAYPATRHHIGTDYACPKGTPIYAPWEGESIEIGYSKVLGNYCVYTFKFGLQSYAMRVLHLDEMPIKGKYKRGAVIGYSGNTGMSSGYHAHLDVWYNTVNLTGITATNFQDRTVDPQLLFN